MTSMRDRAKSKLDGLMLSYKVQSVGSYFDCITMKENVPGFIHYLTELGIRVTDITWWCPSPFEGNKETGCPHGGGGPISQYLDGHFFSEMYQIPDVKITDNDEIIPYIFGEWLNRKEYLPCLIPAFSLDVPDDWREELDSNK